MSAGHLVLAVAIAVVWGVNFVLMKVGLQSMPPFLFAAARFACAAFPLVFFYRRPAIPWPRLVVYATTQFVAQFALLFWGLKLGMPAGLSSTMMQLQAFFTILFAASYLGERPTRAQLGAAVLAAAGLAIVAAHVEGSATLLGLACLVAAAAAWALANIATRRIALDVAETGARFDPMALVAWGSLVATVPLAAMSLVFEGPAAIGAAWAASDWRTAAIIVFNGYVITTFGFGAWSFLLRRYPAALVAAFALLVPVAGLTSAAWLLDEPLHGWTLAAAALVVGGLAVNQVAGARRRPAGAR